MAEKKTFEIGDLVKCKHFGPLKYDFKGKIDKIYENSALVRFTDYDPKDKIAVGDLHNQAIVRLSSMTKIKTK